MTKCTMAKLSFCPFLLIGFKHPSLIIGIIIIVILLFFSVMPLFVFFFSFSFFPWPPFPFFLLFSSLFFFHFFFFFSVAAASNSVGAHGGRQGYDDADFLQDKPPPSRGAGVQVMCACVFLIYYFFPSFVIRNEIK